MITGFDIFIQEEIDQCPLQSCSQAFIQGKTGTGDFYTGFEIDQIIFPGKFPMGQIVFMLLGYVVDNFNDLIVCFRLSFSHRGMGHIGQAEQNVG